MNERKKDGEAAMTRKARNGKRGEFIRGRMDLS